MKAIRYTWKYILLLIIVTLLTSMNVFAEDGVQPTDKDGDGRISQGYIVIGESHVGCYNMSMIQNPVTRFQITSPNGLEVQQFPNKGDKPSTGHSAVWVIAGQQCNEPGWLVLGGEGYTEINNIISTNPTIEHWNLLICWGTNYAVISKGVDPDYTTILSEVDNVRNLFKDKYSITSYYLAVPSIQPDIWANGNGSDHANAVSAMTDFILKNTKVTPVDLRISGGKHSWNSWVETIRKGGTLVNDSLCVKKPGCTASGNCTDAGCYDGCHLSLSAYQDVFGYYIQSLENTLGAVKKTESKPESSVNYIKFEDLKFNVTRDNGFLDSFYNGLKQVNCDFTKVGYTDIMPIIDSNTLAWNIWYNYVNQYDKKDKMSKSSYKLITESWSKNYETQIPDAVDRVWNSYLEVPNSGKLTMQKISDNQTDNKSSIALSIIASAKENKEQGKNKFVIVQAGNGSMSFLSSTGATKYYLLTSIDGTKAVLTDYKTGQTKTITYSDSTSPYRQFFNANPLAPTLDYGITNAYIFEYTGATSTVPVAPPTPPTHEIGTWEDLTVVQLSVDIPNFNGEAKFVWASDLHIIGNENEQVQQRYANLLGSLYDGAKLLDEIANYAEANGRTLILGGDIVDYASEKTYSAVSNALSDRSNNIYYIRADHDIATDINNPSGWDAGTARAKSNQLPGVFGDNLKTISIDGLSASLINFSTNRNEGNTSGSISHNGIVLTHVPFDYMGAAEYTKQLKANLYYYCWTDLTDNKNLYLFNNNKRISEYWRSLQLNGVGAVFAGHTHTPIVREFKDADDTLQEYLLCPAYNKIIYDITVK